MSGDRPPMRPPRVGEALLLLLLPRPYRDAVAGDLREEYAMRFRQSGHVRALAWYCTQVLTFRYVALHRETRRLDAGVAVSRRISEIGVMHDLRFAVRSAFARPALSGLVAVTIALSIAATTVVYGVVDGVLLRPLPYPEPERLVQLWQTNESWGEQAHPLLRSFAQRFPASYDVYEDWRSRTSSYAAIGVWDDVRVIIGGGDRPERLEAARVTAGIFEALDVVPLNGRVITARDDRMGAPALAVLSNGFWMRQFGGDPGVRGRTVLVDGVPHEVVGVMPRRFRFPDERTEMWLTFTDAARSLGRGSQGLETLARLRRGVTIESAAAELDAVAARLAVEHPEHQAGFGARIVPRVEEVVGDVRPILVLVLCASLLVLVIASANVANLLLVRVSSRRRELAVRAALGEGTRRLVQTLLAESIVLAAAGGIAGVIAAAALLPTVVRQLPPSIPRTGEIVLDARVLAFAFAATMVSALAAGLAPALAGARRGVASVLRDEARGSVASRGATRVQSGLVIAEVALAFLLLAATGVLARSLAHLLAVDPGFSQDNLIVAQLELPRDRYDAADAIHGVADRIVARVRALPGVERLGIVDDAPFTNRLSSGSVVIERRTTGEEVDANVDQAVASDGYFEALRIPVIAGRTFTPADRPGAPPVAVVSHTMADRYWPGESALGKRIKDDGRDRPWLTVVGVVGDAHQSGLDTRPHEKMYTPYAQERDPSNSLNLVIRTERDPSSVLAALPDLVGFVDEGIPVAQLARMSELIGRSTAVPRFRTVLIGALALIAAMLAVAGLYGVMAFTVARRTAEIGVRLALGATPARVLAAVVARGARLAAAGIIIGGVAAVFALRLLEAFVFAIHPTDPPTLVAIALLLLATAAAATWLPGRRAARIDPLEALRRE